MHCAELSSQVIDETHDSNALILYVLICTGNSPCSQLCIAVIFGGGLMTEINMHFFQHLRSVRHTHMHNFGK